MGAITDMIDKPNTLVQGDGVRLYVTDPCVGPKPGNTRGGICTWGEVLERMDRGLRTKDFGT